MKGIEKSLRLCTAYSRCLAIKVCSQEASPATTGTKEERTLAGISSDSKALQSHSQCQQQPSGSMTRTGFRPLEQVGMGGGSHFRSTSSTTLSCLQMAMVQLHSHQVSFSYRRQGMDQSAGSPS